MNVFFLYDLVANTPHSMVLLEEMANWLTPKLHLKHLKSQVLRVPGASKSTKMTDIIPRQSEHARRPTKFVDFVM